MTRRTAMVLQCTLTGLLSLQLVAQQRHASVRDEFWSASDLVSVTPNPAHRSATRHTGGAPGEHTPPKQGSGSGSSGVDAASNSGSPAAGGEMVAGKGNAVRLVSENGYGAAPHLVLTSASRLGLRYSVLLRGADGEYAEVGPGTTFHSGDHIRLSLMANEPGYLYVIEQGSSGSWLPIFPRAGAPDGNRIEQGKLQEVPHGTQAFVFDEHPGEDKLFVILSRTPITDLDRRIEALKGAAPAAGDTPPVTSSGEMLEAQNHIPDVFVQQLASRDLMLVDEEKVDQAPTASYSGEKAVYVVSKATGEQGSASTASEIVARITLHHE